MATRKLQITYVAHVVFQLESTDQKGFWLSSKTLPYMNSLPWLLLSSSKSELLAANIL